ncbi:uncharacterized protein N7483_008726 [Penicillium malachiteum]|uniref:uncharacterized protein n=1 Tax=Penicillium malachiteum TaxID=1324776 RepID=UPI0025495280|nr:uncharacterized protein N7483_008726 [Penicillium malachiteum]KAJ5720792.1 hypothetical protein N7483_008726 [Penicillium malachiteum]
MFWLDIGVDKKEERFDVLEQIPSWWVIMRVVVMHASFREAAQTGLFGHLGDATVQIVSLADEKKANALYDFAEKCDWKAASVEETRRDSEECLKEELKECIDIGKAIVDNASSRNVSSLRIQVQ